MNNLTINTGSIDIYDVQIVENDVYLYRLTRSGLATFKGNLYKTEDPNSYYFGKIFFKRHGGYAVKKVNEAKEVIEKYEGRLFYTWSREKMPKEELKKIFSDAIQQHYDDLINATKIQIELYKQEAINKCKQLDKEQA